MHAAPACLPLLLMDMCCCCVVSHWGAMPGSPWPHLGLQIVAAIKAGDEQQRVELQGLGKLLEPFRSAAIEGHAGILITHLGCLWKHCKHWLAAVLLLMSLLIRGLSVYAIASTGHHGGKTASKTWSDRGPWWVVQFALLVPGSCNCKRWFDQPARYANLGGDGGTEYVYLGHHST